MNAKLEKIKTLISDMSVEDEKVKEEVENLTTELPQKDKDEIISLLKKKRPTLYSSWILEIASEYM